MAVEKGYGNIYEFWVNSPYRQYIKQETLQHVIYFI